MDPVLIGLTLFFSTATGAVIWWLVQAEVGLRRLREDLESAHSETCTSLKVLNSRTSDLADSALALQRAYPGLSGVIDAHRTLDRLQSTLSGAGEAEEVRTAATAALSTVRSLLASRTGPADLESPTSADQGLLQLVTRIIQTLDQLELSAADLGLSGLESRRFGEVAFLSGDRKWALSCYQESARLVPRDTATLRSLCRLARESGDETQLRDRLENLLTVTPDEPQLLREHARILTKMGDLSAEKDLRRLEAMGVQNAEDKSMLANLAVRAGDSDVALESIEAAIADNPTGEDWLRKAKIHLERNERGLGITAVDEAIALNRQSGEAWAVRSQLLLGEAGRIEEALKACIHAVALGEPLELLKAELLERLDRTSEAHESLTSSLTKNPGNANVRAQLALMRHQSGNVEGAFELLADAPAEAWKTSPLHIQKGRLILQEADRCRDGTGERDQELLSEADICFDAALSIDRENGIAWLGKARIQRMLGDLPEAQISLARARRLLPNEPLIAAEEALLALDGNDVEAAGRLISEAHVLERDSDVIDYVKGVVAARRGEFEEARRLFDTVLRANPNHVRARLNRCSTLMLQQDYHTALDDVEALLTAHPNLDLARLKRGEIMMALGEFVEAEGEFRDILSRRKSNPYALTQLGASLIAQERLTEAEQPLNETIRLDPTGAEGWYQRGLLYLEFGQIESALSDFDTAASRDKFHMNALLRIAAIHHESKHWEQAEEAWRNVLNVEPDNRIARRRIQDAFDGQTEVKKVAVLSSISGTAIGELEMPTQELEMPTQELEMPTQELEMPTQELADKPRGTAMDWVDEIEAYIKKHGGVVNQDFKRLGLIPNDITSGERARLNEELADCFTKHKVNNFRIFYCSPSIIEPNEVQAQYEKNVEQEDFEFGFGTL
ncbi:MAG: tetratricopeptide repeat protein [Candidatus Thalassarchaeaceae archaeon]|nr:tetratricopeptide repeat protein [Candidatus Thalassarchaeaceae archaeon]